MTSKRAKVVRIVGLIVVIVLVPLVVAAGVWLFADRNYMLVSIVVALLALLPFFVGFERRGHSTRELVCIAALTALSVLGRIVFAFLPGFKPVTAVVVVVGMCFGAEAGFVSGALSALLSNVVYGQGPWTPFQMLAWGLCGFVCGIVFFRRGKPSFGLGKSNKVVAYTVIAVVGVVCGFGYSAVVDVWTAVSIGGSLTMQSYLAAVATSLPVSVEYALSNVVFLFVLYKPLANRLQRVKKKYGVFGGQDVSCC